jgi:hypothetical protein
MKRRNLADVLLKILGLSICIYKIPSFLIGIIFASLPSFVGPTSSGLIQAIAHTLSYTITDGLQAGVGIFIIFKSRKIAEFWFRNEDE